jgi:predicted ATP-grasp superfamily ATP-dependent carboligase
MRRNVRKITAAAPLRPAVVLTDNRGGLGAARSLARRGVPIIAVTWDADNLLLYSRVPTKKFVVTGSSVEEKHSSLMNILMSVIDDKPALITSSDRMISFIAGHREILSQNFQFNLPGTELIESLNDKKKETVLIESLGVAVPATVQDLPSDPSDLEAMLRYPILFKPPSYEAKSFFPRKNEQVRNPSELQSFYALHAEAIPALLAQEIIPGPDGYSWVSSCTFDCNHNMLDCAIKQKISMYPPHFGGSTFAVSASNSEVYELTRKVGNALGFIGHAGIEFRWDARDGQYKYIECNPRMPENVEFDEYCDMPTVWNSYLVALGNDPKRSEWSQRDGVIYLDLDGDLRGRLADGESLLAILASYLKYMFRRRKGPSFAIDDPLPGFIVARRALRTLWRRALSRVTR